MSMIIIDKNLPKLKEQLNNINVDFDKKFKNLWAENKLTQKEYYYKYLDNFNQSKKDVLEIVERGELPEMKMFVNSYLSAYKELVETAIKIIKLKSKKVVKN